MFNERFARHFSHFAMRYQVKKALSLTLKQNTLNIALSDISFTGFILINGYVIFYETLYLLTVNIAGYFMLICKNKN